MSSPVLKYYRFQSKIYDWTRWMFLFGRKEAARRFMTDPKGSYLEVGCGTGLNFPLFIPKVDPAAGSFVGLDFSKDMLARALPKVRGDAFRHVGLVAADATRMQFRRKFDGIIFAYSLTMIPDWRKSLQKAFEHLKPGGTLAVLDFDQFGGFWPFGFLPRGWLRYNHVETTEPYIGFLAGMFDELEVHHRLGGWYFLALGRKKA
jgi:S-adenosylmethionine-diacylgycerolhomoserine-N-methlytransferase